MMQRITINATGIVNCIVFIHLFYYANKCCYVFLLLKSLYMDCIEYYLCGFDVDPRKTSELLWLKLMGIL